MASTFRKVDTNLESLLEIPSVQSVTPQTKSTLQNPPIFNVLLIGDDLARLVFFGMMAEQQGFKVSVQESLCGRAGNFEQKGFDIIISDAPISERAEMLLLGRFMKSESDDSDRPVPQVLINTKATGRRSAVLSGACFLTHMLERMPEMYTQPFSTLAN